MTSPTDFTGIHGERVSVRRAPLGEIVLTLDGRTVCLMPMDARKFADEVHRAVTPTRPVGCLPTG